MICLTPRAEAAKSRGATLPEQVRREGPGRYRSLQSWDKTVRWFRRVYAGSDGLVWRRLQTPPHVEGFYIQNLRPGRNFDGINVYRATRGKHEGVHIYVVPRSDG